MSVGHVARVFEQAGLPTTAVYIRAFRHVVEEMRLPRAVITRHPMGRPLGAPGDDERHLTVLRRAIELLDSTRPGERRVVELAEPYRVP